MALSERERFELYERLSEVLGEENGGRLMEILPTTSFQDLATKRDLVAFRAELTGELAGEFATLHREFAAIHARFASVDSEFASVRTDIAEAKAEAAANLRIMVGAYLSTFVIMLGFIATRL